MDIRQEPGNNELHTKSSSLILENEIAEGFYIGWVSAAPKSFTRFIKKYLVILLVFVILLGALLALLQKKFATGVFEFGQLTEVKGVFFRKPVACLKVVYGKDIWGNLSYLTVPLVGYGKHGADGTIADFEKEKNITLDKKEITLKGTLLYNDGKVLLQIDRNSNPVTHISAGFPALNFSLKSKELGIQKVKGEIIDSKCFFGVMKPGEGKPHSDCAIRCILGGIPPMMVVRNEKGEANYYMIVGSHEEAMNEVVRDFVAEPVEIEARLVQWDDLIVMYVDGREKIKRYSYLQADFNGAIQSCSIGSTK